MKTRSWKIQGSFGLDGLRLVEGEVEDPGPGEVQVAIRAVSLNYRDLMMVEGSYDPSQDLPLVPCSDAAGEVVAVGDEVEELAVGDRVIPCFAQGWIAGRPTRPRLRRTLGGPLPGTLTDARNFPVSGVVKAPECLSWEEAATLPCAGLTAWSALTLEGDLGPGQTLLTLGTGGVSLFALQLGRALGAEVLVTSSSDEKLERARNLGARHGINYSTESDWGRKAKELTGGEGVDQVIEVGGAKTLRQSLQAVRIGGTISVIGVLSGAEAPLSVVPILMRRIRLQGILVGHRDGLHSLVRAVDAREIHPVVDRTFPFEEAPAAFEHVKEGKHFGKIVIRPD
ncbi:MAG: NAD(P)-dependent alcohol dehydrogenase [Thermoanaerobaculia bacterium]|nr:NAD(P)-dependent alcohol dehydrogenase [Thermoanaerobaculia bacterium]